MLSTGLVSVTFRKLSVTRIIDLVAEAGLRGIEWGGDIHLPPGDPQLARQIRLQTLEHGLLVASYGSYYRVGSGEAPFDPVLETAVELGAPTIRVWAGRLGTAQASEEHWHKTAQELREIAENAASAGISISCEFHEDTLTDSTESTLRLLDAAAHPNLFTYWQVPGGFSRAENQQNLKLLLGRISNLHVFTWKAGYERCPLADGEEDWRAYLEILRSSRRHHYAMLEFVQSDSIAAFRRDAQTLKRWLNG